MEEGKAGLSKDEEASDRIRGTHLTPNAETTFRSVTALINFILPDRPDAMYAGKEVLRAMSEPGEEDLRRLKRLLRYLKGTASRAIIFPWDQQDQDIEAEVDSEFAGCMITRRSTCGGVIRWRGGMIRSWSKTMPTLALSTGEAELGAAARGAGGKCWDQLPPHRFRDRGRDRDAVRRHSGDWYFSTSGIRKGETPISS